METKVAVAAVVKGAVVLGGVCMLPYFSEKKGGTGELEWCVLAHRDDS